MRGPWRRLLQALIWVAALAPPVVAVGYLLYGFVAKRFVTERPVAVAAG